MKVNTFVIDFPAPEPKEAVTKCDDGSYSIFLNAKQTEEQNRRSLLHAIWHIENEDFSKSDIQIIETEAHKKCR